MLISARRVQLPFHISNKAIDFRNLSFCKSFFQGTLWTWIRTHTHYCPNFSECSVTIAIRRTSGENFNSCFVLQTFNLFHRNEQTVYYNSITFKFSLRTFVKCLNSQTSCVFLFSKWHPCFRLTIMNNILPSSITMHLKFDLKGSTYKRKVSFHYLKIVLNCVANFSLLIFSRPTNESEKKSHQPTKTWTSWTFFLMDSC